MSSRRERWREYEQQWLRKHAMQRRLARIFKQSDEPDDDADNGDDDAIADDRLDGDNGNGPRHVVDELADLLVEGGSPDGEVTREQALQWLLHSERGQALVARMAQHRKRKAFTMNRSEQLRAVVRKAGGIVSLCKSIAATGRCAVTEHELTALAVAEAKRLYPDIKDDARAFAKMFTDVGPTGTALRRAVQIAKAAQLEIMPDATAAGDTDVEDDSGKTTAQMERLVDEQIRRSPEMTRSQAWNVVVHENPMLARCRDPASGREREDALSVPALAVRVMV